jgi:hypothetical protein
MRIDETKRSHIDEGPLDLLTKSGRAQRKSFKQGQQLSKQAVSGLRNEFARYLGSQGKRNFNQATTQELIDFLKSKSVDTSDIDTTQPMNQKRIENIFKQKVQQTTSLSRPTASTQTGQTSATPAQAGPAAKPSSAYTQTKTSAMKLSAKEKRRLIAQLQKTLPSTASSSKNSKPSFRSKRTTATPPTNNSGAPSGLS